MKIRRIPELSDKFLYFNDDIFLGEEILPEDFITSRGGQKVYLSWPVPDCSDVCPWSWVGDGTCDMACNTSACDFDGSDCLPSVTTQHPHHPSLDYEDVFTDKLPQAKDKPYRIHTDEDLNKLITFLASNGSALTTNLVHDVFLLLQKMNKTNFSNGSAKTGMIGGNFNWSILLQKLGQNFPNNEKQQESMSVSKAMRDILSVRIVGETERNEEFKQSIFSGRSNPRLFSPLNLTRSQVGVPPLGVAERFYALESDTSSLRHSLDTFAESLLHVNSLLNRRYGYTTRKVPAHMPHLVDKSVVSSLQSEFLEEFERTSSHYFRHPQDMQFSFSYFYYLISEEIDLSVSDMFDLFDTDSSGTWSDREIRTVLTRLYDLPLQRSSVLNFETSLLHCANSFQQGPPQSTPMFERYIDSKLPLVTKQLIENCTLITKMLNRKMGKKRRFQYTLVKQGTREASVGFHMITSNLSSLLVTLDKIRKRPKKFICLNDNMDNSKEDENQLIRAVLIDFLHSLFPKPSQFELPSDYRNRYLYYNEFIAWQSNKKRLSLAMYTLLLATVCLIFYCTFYYECQRILNRTKRKLAKTVPCLKCLRRKVPNKL